jgi:hypothetical protein
VLLTKVLNAEERDTVRNVQRWRDGTMIKRSCAAGMLNAERSFRRVKGYKQMAGLVAALATPGRLREAPTTRGLRSTSPAWGKPRRSRRA